MKLHIGSLLCHATRQLDGILDDTVGRADWYGLDEMQDGSVVLVVGSEEEKSQAEEVVRTFGVIAPWRRVFSVEIEV